MWDKTGELTLYCWCAENDVQKVTQRHPAVWVAKQGRNCTALSH